mmetsp:Transcript_112665/g.318305  ORF Transcript_112665/g.318305 Transcript_112665/m.318305 type:complete len:659 (-) Transcript_112665:313-2289(-)
MASVGGAVGHDGRRKMLFVGDAEGRLSKLFDQVTNQQKRVGNFDVLFAVGSFLPGSGAPEAAAQFAKFAMGKEKAPVATYFVESTSAALLQTAPDGKQLCENVQFLGGYGIREIQGLQVAYLSGHYDVDVYGGGAQNVASPDFIGSAYTPRAVEALIRLACEPDRPAVDVLLTADWPRRLEEKLEEAEKPKDPDGKTINWAEKSAPPIAELCAALEPRYHVFGTNDVFYQRPPFQTAKRGHVCRCIALGKVGSKGKERLWIHGLQLTPSTLMTEVALKQRPENTTPCPFIVAAATPSVDVATGEAATLPSTKRDAEEMNESNEAMEVPNEVFLSRLPANMNERHLEKALKTYGTIESVRLARDEGAEGKPCKGFGWVTFSTPEEAQAACALNGMLECNGRAVGICISKRQPGREGGAPKKKREVQIVIEPHSECWFCLVNPKVEKHMIIAATTDVYIACARGPVNPMHVLVLPVKHAPCFAACPRELQEALSIQIGAIRKMCHEADQDCLVWERWIPMGISAANHMQIQVLPVDRKRAGDARSVLEVIAKKRLDGAKFRRITAHREVVEHAKDDSGTPYIYFEIPGDNTAKGRQIERFVYAGSPGGPRLPMNIGREVACELLGCEGKLDWKQCQEDKSVEKRLAESFRAKFKAFQPRK